MKALPPTLINVKGLPLGLYMFPFSTLLFHWPFLDPDASFLFFKDGLYELAGIVIFGIKGTSNRKLTEIKIRIIGSTYRRHHLNHLIHELTGW
jgi:hypothetical protein